MTQTFWNRYFRIGQLAVLLPLVEYVAFRTIWSLSLVMVMLAIPVFTLECNSCGLRATDHRIATHFRGSETLKDCPNCHRPMVEQA